MHRRALSAAIALVAVSACTEGPQLATVPSIRGSSADVSPDQSNPHRHSFDLRTSVNLARAAVKSSGTGIYYHGGPVLLAGPKVTAVYWAGSPIYDNGPTPGTSGASCSDQSLIATFLHHLGGSSYFNINTTYTDAQGRHIANAVSYAQCWANNTNVPANGQSVSDADILSMLASGFNSGALTYDAQTVYAVFTAGTVNLGGGFGSQYCAYHAYGTVTINGQSKAVIYAAMPYDYAYRSACTPGVASPNADAAANAEVNTLAHEVEEATTDMYLNAWYDRRGYENADKCAWTFGTTYTTANGGVANMNLGGYDFLIQRNWVNAGSGGCFVGWP